MSKKKSKLKSMSPSLRRLAVFGGVLLIIGLVLVALDWRLGSNLATETAINIKSSDGHEYITEDTVIKIILEETNQNLADIKIGNLNIKSIEASLRKNPFIKDAEVYVDGRNHIHIDIEQRKPIVRIMGNKNQNYYLDIEGERVPISNNDVARVPVVTGDIPKYRKGYQESSVHGLTTLYNVAKYIYEDDFLKPLIEQIAMDENENLTLVPKLGHHTIEFGTDERLEKKFRNLKIFYKEALPYHGWEKYSEISLKYAGQVVGIRAGLKAIIPKMPVDTINFE